MRRTFRRIVPLRRGSTDRDSDGSDEMNDYQMSSLAQDRSRDLMAEAHAARLAREAKRPAKAQKESQRRSSFRVNLGSLLGRSPA